MDPPEEAQPGVPGKVLTMEKTVIFDPSTIPREDAEYLGKETLRLVRWMMTIPKYRDAILELAAAMKAAGERKEG